MSPSETRAQPSQAKRRCRVVACCWERERQRSEEGRAVDHGTPMRKDCTTEQPDFIHQAYSLSTSFGVRAVFGSSEGMLNAALVLGQRFLARGPHDLARCVLGNSVRHP